MELYLRRGMEPLIRLRLRATGTIVARRETLTITSNAFVEIPTAKDMPFLVNMDLNQAVTSSYGARASKPACITIVRKPTLREPLKLLWHSPR